MEVCFPMKFNVKLRNTNEPSLWKHFYICVEADTVRTERRSESPWL